MDSHEKQQADSISTPITRRSVVLGVMWSAIEKFSYQGIRFLVSLVMARLLCPEEYGVFAIIGVIIGISEIFIDSGLAGALIHKIDCTKSDYSTVNWVNIGVSSLFYVVLFFLAPTLASFYDLPILVPTIRVTLIAMIISSISAVGRTILEKKMMFKKISLITLATSLFSGFVGILMASLGFGIWALVIQFVASTTFAAIWIMIVSGYRPQLLFSKSSFKELFGFGSKMLGSDIISVIFKNIYPLIIGKGFNASSVGYYTRANYYSTLVPLNFSGVLESVLFPVFSNMQNDEERLERLYQKTIMVASILVFAGSFFLIGLAYPLILNLISSKWLPCVPLLQIMCVGALFSHIASINGRLLVAKGHPGVFLKTQLIAKPIEVLIIIVSIFGGLKGLAWGQVAIVVVNVIINCGFFYKATGINPLKMLKPLMTPFLFAGIIGLSALYAFNHVAPTMWNLIIAIVVMVLTFGLLIRIAMPNLYHDMRGVFRR